MDDLTAGTTGHGSAVAARGRPRRRTPPVKPAGDVWVVVSPAGWWDGRGWVEDWRDGMHFPMGGGYDACAAEAERVYTSSGEDAVPRFVSAR